MLYTVVLVLALCLVAGSLAAETSTTGAKNASSAAVEKTEVTLKQAINIVEKRRLTECVARTICELSCNPDTYGPKGKQVYQTLKQFESDTMPKLTYYKNARDKGLSLMADEKCAECDKAYTNCKTSADSLLRLANSISIKQ